MTNTISNVTWLYKMCLIILYLSQYSTFIMPIGHVAPCYFQVLIMQTARKKNQFWSINLLLVLIPSWCKPVLANLRWLVLINRWYRVITLSLLLSTVTLTLICQLSLNVFWSLFSKSEFKLHWYHRSQVLCCFSHFQYEAMRHMGG